MSHRAAMLPGTNGAGIRQAVVKIKSRQSLERLNEHGRAIAGSGESQDKVEYIVIQRKYWEGGEQQWLVWGTVGESDWKKATVES